MAVVPIVGSSIPLPAAIPGSVRFDVILIAPDGLNAQESFVIDGALLPTERERYYSAMVQVARTVRDLITWKYGP